MASFDVSSLQKLLLDMDKISEIPDDVMEKILLSQGEIVASAQKRSIRSHNLVDTGLLESSITISKKPKRLKTGRYILVYPAGKRPESDVTNTEVAFINEFGASKKHLQGTMWMREANERCSDEVVASMKKIYDDWLSKKGF